MIARLRHRLAHWLKCNKGTIKTWWEGDKLMIGFLCECGEMEILRRRES